MHCKPVVMTAHARMRLAQRLGITDPHEQVVVMRDAFRGSHPVPEEIRPIFLRVSNSTSFRYYKDAVFIFRGANRHALVTVVSIEEIVKMNPEVSKWITPKEG